VRGLLVVLFVLAAAVAFGCSDSGGDEGQTVRKDAPAPTLGTARLRRLELTHEVPVLVREACAEARRLAEVHVVCPPLVPDVPLTRSEGLWGAIVPIEEPRFYMLTFNNGGLPGGRRHWITGGGEAGAVGKWALTDFQNVVKGDPTLVRTMEAHGRRVSIYHFPPYPAGGPNGGHWAAFVQIGDEIVFASPHERRYVQAAVEMALALAEELESSS
jgi:hypothetical protein